MSIQKRLTKLKPYVSGIRFEEDLPVVDAQLTNGWGIKKHGSIQVEKGKKVGDDKIHIMFYGISADVEIDTILDHVEIVVERNLERERKFELLKTKAEELQEFFKGHSYDELLTLRFEVDKPSLISRPTEVTIEDEEREPEEQEEEIEEIQE